MTKDSVDVKDVQLYGVGDSIKMSLGNAIKFKGTDKGDYWAERLKYWLDDIKKTAANYSKVYKEFTAKAKTAGIKI